MPSEAHSPSATSLLSVPSPPRPPTACSSHPASTPQTPRAWAARNPREKNKSPSRSRRPATPPVARILLSVSPGGVSPTKETEYIGSYEWIGQGRLWYRICGAIVDGNSPRVAWTTICQDEKKKKKRRQVRPSPRRPPAQWAAALVTRTCRSRPASTAAMPSPPQRVPA